MKPIAMTIRLDWRLRVAALSAMRIKLGSHTYRMLGATQEQIERAYIYCEQEAARIWDQEVRK